MPGAAPETMQAVTQLQTQERLQFEQDEQVQKTVAHHAKRKKLHLRGIEPRTSDLLNLRSTTELQVRDREGKLCHLNAILIIFRSCLLAFRDQPLNHAHSRHDGQTLSPFEHIHTVIITCFDRIADLGPGRTRHLAAPISSTSRSRGAETPKPASPFLPRKNTSMASGAPTDICKAADVRHGAGSRNFSTVRRERASPGAPRDLAHKIDCGLIAHVANSVGIRKDSEDMVYVRQYAAASSNLRMKTAEGNRVVDKGAEEGIMGILRGNSDLNKLQLGRYRTKIRQYEAASDGAPKPPKGQAKAKAFYEEMRQLVDAFAAVSDNTKTRGVTVKEGKRIISRHFREGIPQATEEKASAARVVAKAAGPKAQPATASPATVHVGPRGGRYTVSESGKKQYLSSGGGRSSFASRTSVPARATPASSTSRGSQVYVGPRGGRYTISASGRKRYI